MPRTKKEEKESAPVVEEKPKEETKKEEFEVKEPQVLRPKELPLVITPTSGEWANPEQAAFAANLNAYAYKNHEKWKVKKPVLLAQLSEIGKNPSAFQKYTGLVSIGGGKLSYRKEGISNQLEA